MVKTHTNIPLQNQECVETESWFIVSETECARSACVLCCCVEFHVATISVMDFFFWVHVLCIFNHTLFAMSIKICILPTNQNDMDDYETLYYEDPSMDFIYIWHDGRYRFTQRHLCPRPDLEVKVTDRIFIL